MIGKVMPLLGRNLNVVLKCKVDVTLPLFSAFASTYTSIRSYPIILNTNRTSTYEKQIFRLQNMRLGHTSCSQVVAQAWNDNFVGCQVFLVMNKITATKREPMKWDKEFFGKLYQD